MKFTVYTLLFILSITASIAQKRTIEKFDFKTDYKLNSEIETKLKIDTVAWKHQISAAEYATKGDYKNALIQWDLEMGTRDKNFTNEQVDSINSKYRKINASEYILERAKQNRLVIINEAHHNSFHRTFTKSLLKRLFADGYTFIGLEALSYDDMDSLQTIRKYPIQKTGYYTKDPQFGNLIREGIEIGYTIFPYETKNGEHNGKLREIEQAKNIQQIIAANPDAKYLIHCGFDHVLEGTHSSWEMAMAERLKEYTGIDPLTINQVAYSEKSKPEFNNPLLKALNIEESSVILDQNNKPLKYERGEAYTDIAVFHPNTQYINNRPDWLFKNENEKVMVSLQDIEISYPVLVLAFNASEDIKKAVPIDITEIKNSSEECILVLKKGKYTIVATNGKQSVKFGQNVE